MIYSFFLITTWVSESRFQRTVFGAFFYWFFFFFLLTEESVLWFLSKCFKVSWVKGVLNLNILKAQIKSLQCWNHSKNAAVSRRPLQHIGPSPHSQAFAHLLAFQKLMKTEACTRHARPDSALTAFTLQPQTLGLQLLSWLMAGVRKDQGSHGVYWEKDCNRADSLGKHHQAVENPEGKQLSAEGEKSPKRQGPYTVLISST